MFQAKRMLAVVLAVLMVCVAMPLTVFADTTEYTAVVYANGGESAAVAVGDEVTITVNATAADIAALCVSFGGYYDTSAFEFVSGEWLFNEGAILEDVDTEKQNAAICWDTDKTGYQQVDGPIFQYVLRVKEGATDGTYTINPMVVFNTSKTRVNTAGCTVQIGCAHEYTADCDATCNVCGTERTDVTGHTWSGTSCTACGETRTVTGITVSTLPNKTMYSCTQVKDQITTIDALDVTGGKLTVTYSEGESEIIDMTAEMASADLSTLGPNTVTVNYAGQTTSYEVKLAVAFKLPSATGRSIVLKGAVSIKQYMDFVTEGTLSDEFVIENSGLLVWTEDNAPASEMVAVLGTETNKYTYSVSVSGYSRYEASTDGIFAYMWGDTYYMRSYVTIDGVTYYSPLGEYGVSAYCYSQIAKSTTSEKVKATCIAMINYGAAAQVQFNYKVNSLVDANLTEAQKALPWDDSYPSVAVEPDASVIGMFERKNMDADSNDNKTNQQAMYVRGKSIILNGAISIKYYMRLSSYATEADKLAIGNAQERAVYFWDKATYESLLADGGTFTKENAKYSVSCTTETDANGNIDYTAKSDGIYAHEMENTVYAAFYMVDANGKEYCSGVIAYHPEQYAKNQIEKASASETTKNTSKRLIVYAECAKRQFGS